MAQQFDINTYSTAQMHFEQQLEHLPNGLEWLIETLKSHVTGNMLACYVIVHNKDVTYDEDNNTVPVAPHVHIALHFQKPVKVMSVLKWLGMEDKPQQFHKAAKNARFGSLISYLTHRTPNDKQKYQYSPADVITVTGEEYPDALERVTGEVLRAERVKHGRTDERNADEEEFLSRILPLIANGTIAPYNRPVYIKQEEYVRYKAAINKALEYKELELALEKDRTMRVYFVCGGSNSGKTTVSKELACLLLHVTMQDIFISSGGKNPLDDYGGEPVIILDDLRASDFKLNDLLKLLDNDTASMAGARYFNKSLARCRAVFITSTQPLEKWYSKVQETDGEAILQFSRRVIQIRNVEMNHEDWCYRYQVLQGGTYTPVPGAVPVAYQLIGGTWKQSPFRRFAFVTHYNKESAIDELLTCGEEYIMKDSDRAGYQYSLGENTNNLQEINENETDDELPF